MLNSSCDIKGLAFQKFIHRSQRAGRGQFFTPEQVIKLCVEMMQPQQNEKILDPTCGSGGFLSAALQYVASHNPKKLQAFAKNNIFGIEINRTVARMAKMNMILSGDGFSNIAQCDSLSDMSDITIALNKKSEREIGSYQGFFDIVLTNPPFGTQGRVTDKSVLRNFDLGYKWNCMHDNFLKSDTSLNGQVPEILFIERCLQFLKPGGKMTIVLPNGNFENTSLSYLRNYIKNSADVLAVVKLPQETFIPSGTGVKTSILFLRKKIEGKSAVKKVFFSQVTKLGYVGNKNGTLMYKKDRFGNPEFNERGEHIIDEDVSEVLSSYLEFKSGKQIKNTKNTFLISQKSLGCNRFDFEFHKPEYKQIEKILLSAKSRRLSDLVRIKKAKPEVLAQKENIVRYVELSDVSVQYNEIMNSTEYPVYALPSRASYEIKEGEIVTAVSGNSIGTPNHVSAYVDQEYSECICTNGFRVLAVNSELVNPFYLLYFLRSRYFLNQVYRLRTGAAIPALLDSDLLNVLVLLPKEGEQERIAHLMQDGFKQRKNIRNKISELEIKV